MGAEMEKQQKQRILVVGGGFGGVKAALELSQHPDMFEITLVSERPDFWYFPTFYHTATGGSNSQSTIKLRELFHGKQVTLVEGKAENLDRTAKTVTLSDKTVLPYDRLVLALGVVTNYFGIPGLQEYSFGVKSVAEVETLKKHLHEQITDNSKPGLSYVIVGGGPTGIELAGALGKYIKFIMKNHGIEGRKIHIDLVEGNEHLMPRMPANVGKTIERRLERLGVNLYLGKTVEGATADELMVSGKPIRSHTIIWTAGQANNPFFTVNAFALSPRKKVVVDEFLRAEQDVFVIGDNAETVYSGMAQTAIHDGEFVAHNMVKDAHNEPKIAYRPMKPVYVTPAGPQWAAVEWGKVHLYGKVGWLLRAAGDFVAFTDIENPIKAAGQWAHVIQHQHLCDTCGSVS